jgi:hypothetical protein
LRKFIFMLRWDEISRKEADIDSEYKNKEMDIFMCKIERPEIEWTTYTKSVVVELKHPNISLW